MTILYSHQEQKKSLSRNWTKKTIFILNVDNYAPEITKLTYPFLERYANKINAEFVIIKKRMFPKYPVTYEKLQIYELGRNNDWNIYIDSDCLIHPDFFDMTEVIPENTVLNYNSDFAGNRFVYDNYFRRDGRNIGSINFLTVASSDCNDVWQPLTDITIERAIKDIKTIPRDKAIGHDQSFRIDDYVLSRNIAKYGLKFKTLIEYFNETGKTTYDYLYHERSTAEKDKIEGIKHKLKEWGYT